MPRRSSRDSSVAAQWFRKGFGRMSFAHPDASAPTLKPRKRPVRAPRPDRDPDDIWLPSELVARPQPSSVSAGK